MNVKICLASWKCILYTIYWMNIVSLTSRVELTYHQSMKQHIAGIGLSMIMALSMNVDNLWASDLVPAPMNKLEMLALHRAKTLFAGIVHQPCRFRTSLCPDRCGHAQDVACFDIVDYIEYKKYGQYGDEKQKRFCVSLKKSPENPLSPAILECIHQLKKGDVVELAWAHIYVTYNGSSAPQRWVLNMVPLPSKPES